MTAQYQELDLLFNVSEDLVKGGMCQVVQILSKNLKIQKDWPVSKMEQVQNQVIVRNKDE